MGRSLAAAALIVALLTLASTALAQFGPHERAKTYTDEVGDAGRAADFRSITVANDLMGNYLFTLRFAAPIVKPRAFELYLNTDQDESTGSPSGAEYLVAYSGGDWEFDRWDGSHWVWNRMAGVTGGLGATKNVVEFSIRKSDLAGVRHFDFFVLSDRIDGIDDRDDAPSGGHGMWHFDFVEGFRLANVASYTTPAKVGATWTLGLRTETSDTGSTVAGGKIRCIAAAGTKTLRTVGSGFKDHAGETFATCRFALPKTLEPQVVVARVDVTFRGATATKIFSAPAR